MQTLFLNGACTEPGLCSGQRRSWLGLLEVADPPRETGCASMWPFPFSCVSVRSCCASVSLHSAHMLEVKVHCDVDTVWGCVCGPWRLCVYNTVLSVSSLDSYGISMPRAYSYTFGFGEDSQIYLVGLILRRWQSIPRQMK